MENSAPGPRLIGGRYALQRVVGTGGAAEVWLAQDTVLGVNRAVKMLRLDAKHREPMRRRLHAEARVMSRLSHPNLLHIYDVGSQDDLDYVVMDWSERGSLADLLDREGPLRPQRAIHYAIQVLCALDVAHHSGVIHRDVKPQNILLDAHGNALLADFGIALILDPDTAPRHTVTGTALGSLAYMAPEQRVDARLVDPRADLYALAATLYVLVTRATPIDLFLADARSARWNAVPVPLLPVLRRNLSARPQDRSANAREMADELGQVLAELSADTGPVLTPPVWGATPVAALATTATGTLGDTLPTLADEATPPPVSSPRPLPVERGGARWRRGLALGLLGLAGAGLVGTAVLRAPGTTGTTPPSAAASVVPPAAPASAEARPRPATAPAPDLVEAPATDTIARVPAARRPEPQGTTRAQAAPVEAAAPSSPNACVGWSRRVPAAEDTSGTWAGSFNGRPACLAIQASDAAISGWLRVRYNQAAVDTQVTGSYDPAVGTLILKDPDEVSDGGTYSLTATRYGGWAGRFHRRDEAGTYLISLEKFSP